MVLRPSLLWPLLQVLLQRPSAANTTPTTTFPLLLHHYHRVWVRGVAVAFPFLLIIIVILLLLIRVVPLR